MEQSMLYFPVALAISSEVAKKLIKIIIFLLKSIRESKIKNTFIFFSSFYTMKKIFVINFP